MNDAKIIAGSNKENLFNVLALLGLSVAILSSRWLPHATNFSPVLALLMLSGSIRLKINKFLYLLPLGALIISDLGLGAFDGMGYNYFAYILTIGFGFWVNARSYPQILGGAFATAAIFFFVSNFGVWAATELYPKTWVGLMECYGMGVLFFRSTLVSNVVSALALYTVYNFAVQRVLKRA